MSVQTPEVKFDGATVYMPGHGANSMMWVGDVPKKYRDKIIEALQKSYIMGAAKQQEIIRDVLEIPKYTSDLLD